MASGTKYKMRCITENLDVTVPITFTITGDGIIVEGFKDGEEISHYIGFDSYEEAMRFFERHIKRPNAERFADLNERVQRARVNRYVRAIDELVKGDI
jgi:hypothetical protein